jgi:RNA polymerase sigma-70 factor, ECF subfamily
MVRFKHDSELARRLRARDPQVMSAIYDRYGRAAYSLIYRVVRDAGVAEDLVQETFLRVLSRAQSFDPDRGALGPWILAVARSRAVEHLRSADGRAAAGRAEDGIQDPHLFANFEESATTPDRTRRLKEAFAKLTPPEKEVIELAYFEGLSQTEMAARLKQPLGTVKAWVRTALKALRERLSGTAAA